MVLRHAIARLAAAPMFTIFSVLSLAAGVAVTTAAYSVIDALLLSDRGVSDVDRVMLLRTPATGGADFGVVSDPDFADLRDTQTSFSSLSASVVINPSVTTSTHAEIQRTEAVDGAYFATLGVTPQRGRLIQPSDDAAAAKVAVLSDELWRSRFAADASVVGRAIRINGEPFEVIGIAAARFRGLGILPTTRLWIPLAAEPPRAAGSAGSAAWLRDRPRLAVFGRLAPRVTVEAASAEMATIASRLDTAYPQRQPQGPRGSTARAWSLRPMVSMDSDGSGDRVGLMLVALVGLVLVVACTNLANLVLARGAARQGELAVRMAMGASRGRLIWEQCVESLILAGLGMLASYVLFQGLAALMTVEYTLSVPRLTLSIRPVMNAEALVVALVSTLLALAVFGLEPAVQLARTVDIRSALAAGASGIRPRLRRQRIVIRWQVAVATGFFIVATMFIRGTLQLTNHDPGVDMDRLAVASLNFQNGSWDEQRIRRTIDRLMEEARKDRSIVEISASTGLPFGVPPAMQVAITVPGNAATPARSLAALAATPAIFKTLGVPIVRGRAFTDSDLPGGSAVVILSELAAREFFGSADPLGRPVELRRGTGQVSATVVGVARDTDVRFINAGRRPLVYLPLSQHFHEAITVTARAAGDTPPALTALRDAIRRVDPDLALETIGTGRSTMAGLFGLLRSIGMATLYLGGFTLVLSMVGLFGVQAHIVAHRTREIGVRMAVGATAERIKLMVLKDGYRPVVDGLILGLWGGLAGRAIVRSYMDIDVSVVDPWILVVTPIPVILAAFCACYLPAARASRVDPTVSLRAE